MRINRKLNLVLPVDTPRGTVYVHSTPISRDVFEKYFISIGQAYAAIMQLGLGVQSGPRMAALMLKRVAERTGDWDGPEGVREGLLGEVHRLTNVVLPNGHGWQTMPYEDAVRDGTLDADDAAEVENAVAFFTCISAMMSEADLGEVHRFLTTLFSAQIVSSNSTEFASSLPTSDETASSGGTATTS